MNWAFRSHPGRLRKPVTFLLGLIFLTLSVSPVPAAAGPNRARMVLLMVWDGLRPDAVSGSTTPNLYALRNGGAYFSDHHSMYPSLTMVNGAALATAVPPGANGILANKMYLAHLLGPGILKNGGALAMVQTKPASLENTRLLQALSAHAALDGELVEQQTVAQQVLRMGGFVGIVGKTGPTFLFDDRADVTDTDADREIFVSDNEVRPPSLSKLLGPGMDKAGFTAALQNDPPFGNQDRYLTDVFIDHVLPAAAQALKANRSALLVLWQHNPDITQHEDGLGTANFYRALGICDADLGRVIAALKNNGLANRTDLLVVSDHGFATIKMRIELADLLVAQGLKHSTTSDDVVVASNFGSDEIYISPRLSAAARVELMRRIVAYAAAQPWCGPIFSRTPATQTQHGYAGEIPGTFDQSWFGLLNPARSADLIVSFSEFGGDNSRLTGPRARALVLGTGGERTEPNRSQPLLHPIAGVAYADSGQFATTGNGTHGALGEYDLHNFAAAIGPDFRHHYIDPAPSSNIDIARTIATLLNAETAATSRQPFAARVLGEALNGGSTPAYRRVPLSVALDLPQQRVISTIAVDEAGGERYATAANVKRIKAAKSAATVDPHQPQGPRVAP
jgi:hypothetical protein